MDADTIPPDFSLLPDDIKICFHPNSHQATQFFHFEGYQGPHYARPMESDASTPRARPWAPFRTRLNFEIAELMLESHLNTKQVDVLLSLFQKAINHPDDFTLSRARDLEKIWAEARQTRGTGFEHKTITVPYKKAEIPFQVSVRPLWSWIMELVDDPNLVPLFWWDAERHYRYGGKEWERFVDEPWMANDWWDIQVINVQCTS
ncbi:hypothetical protein CPB84DRAFT_1685948 [Gymnopilus junonius]|uniref:Uncharacterized protein n=1 Tax=Gymnopilus junonius TaxID=109634 RepID=A0A9P5TK07_GYMJU|nr:hypothetical protein CPB84DRAFT_1685948 [Gymnopilus junonius]